MRINLNQQVQGECTVLPTNFAAKLTAPRPHWPTVENRPGFGPGCPAIMECWRQDTSVREEVVILSLHEFSAHSSQRKTGLRE